MISKFKYCPNCKNKVKQREKRLLDCLKCGFHFYLSPASTNAVIIENEKGEILLTRRKFPPKKGYFDLPGGFIDFGETVEESARREIKEELGLIINNLTYLRSYYSFYPYRGIRYQTLCHVYKARISSNQRIRPFDDVTDIKFFAQDKIPFSKLSFGDVKKALKNYTNKYRF